MAALGPGLMQRYRLSVTGPVSRRLLETIIDRFGDVSIERDGDDTVVQLAGADQPALRALLTLLWDAGHDVRGVSSTADAGTSSSTDLPLPEKGAIMSSQNVPARTTVCVVGCGPAGAMLGLMLARAGIDVVVLEKYPDFFRDFRGDTIHASTLQVLADLDLLAGFEQLPQQRTTTIAMMTDEGMVTLGDFTRLPGRFQHLSMVPQWDFLSFITAEARRYRTFTLCTDVEAVGLVEQGGAVRGVRYRTKGDGGEHEVRALLTVAADGRHSTVRRAAGLSPMEFGAPMDLLWYRIPKGPGDPEGSFARLVPGRLFPMIDRRTYWQGAYTMPKGTFATLKAGGIEALRADLHRAMPFLGKRIDEALRSWDDTGFLEVRVNRLRRWHRPGLLCIGDAAHAMSPIAGVGINLAIQDAVAAANLLSGPLRAGTLTERDLARVQRRRLLPTWLTQRVQLAVQRQIISAIADAGGRAGIPLPVRVLARIPLLLRLFSRFMAIGIRNERVAPGIRRPAPADGHVGHPSEPFPESRAAEPAGHRRDRA